VDILHCTVREARCLRKYVTDGGVEGPKSVIYVPGTAPQVSHSKGLTMDTKDVVEEGREAAQETMSDFQNKFEKGKEAAKKYAQQAKEKAGQYAEQAGEYAQKTKDMTEKRIHENPFWSMLVAVGVGAGLGLTLGMIFGSSRRED
jgi:ElaB/YqjD/DUF883 family membrane-anchored ribosome-binding protein